jgi:hypothetical protein
MDAVKMPQNADFPSSETKTCQPSTPASFLANTQGYATTLSMRISAILLTLALASTNIHADPLTANERQELIAKLTTIKKDADERIDNRFRMAIQAYRKAMASNEAAIDLYLKCVEQVDFKDKLKSGSEFRDWKTSQDANLSDPSFKLALRHQLRWLILTLQASSKNPDKPALARESLEIIDSIFLDIKSVQSQSKLLKQNAISSVFAQAYELNNLKTQWPGAPLQLDAIFNSVIMPPLRNPNQTTALRTMWIKRIKLEETNALGWTDESPHKNKKDHNQIQEEREQARDQRTINEEVFNNETRPKLLWEMETDLFKNGDESGAAKRMIEHIQKFITHKDVRNWTQQLSDFLGDGAAKTSAADTPPPAPSTP